LTQPPEVKSGKNADRPPLQLESEVTHVERRFNRSDACNYVLHRVVTKQDEHDGGNRLIIAGFGGAAFLHRNI
jgi:hypothetical protein